jgi:hypothetical protein
MENHRKLSTHNYTTNRLTQLFVSADVFPRQNDFLAFRVIIHIMNSNTYCHATTAFQYQLISYPWSLSSAKRINM